MLGPHVALQCDVSRHSGLGSGKNILKGPCIIWRTSLLSYLRLWCGATGPRRPAVKEGMSTVEDWDSHPSHPEWESEFLQGPQGLHVH